jgi:hypothetical protein
MSDAHKSNCTHNYRNPSSKKNTKKSTNFDIKSQFMFLVYALKFHNTNNEILKSHLEHKPPQTHKIVAKIIHIKLNSNIKPNLTNGVF